MRPNASAIDRTLSPTGRSSEIVPRARGPTAILRMYMSGSDGSDPRGEAAIIEIAFVPPRATTARPSSGSRARSYSSPPAPTNELTASCSSPSGAPITTWPLIGICSSAIRAAENAASSAASLSARPSQRAAASEARSVTRARSRTGTAAGHPAPALPPSRRPRALGCKHHQFGHRVDRPLHVRILDDGDTFAPGPPHQVRLNTADVAKAVEVLVHRADASGRRIADVEVHPVDVLVGYLDHGVHEQGTLELGG